MVTILQRMKMLIVRFVWIGYVILLFVHAIISSLVMNVHVYYTIEKIRVLFVVNVLMKLFVFIHENQQSFGDLSSAFVSDV